MPTNLQCRLAIANNGLVNAGAIQGYAQTISAHLLNGSHGDIVLSCAGPQMIGNPLPQGQLCYAIDLHKQLLWINQNPPNQPLQNICVIYADNYLGLSNVFGIMFDRGFTTQDDPNGAPVYLANPRQGCAVFLGAIAKNRAPNDCALEGLFTTIHEIGHIFNLQHDETVPNFLHSSNISQCFPPGYYQFTPGEQNQLSACSTNSSVMPGGSIFGSGNATNIPLRRGPRKRAPVDIRISVSRTAFWQFEPIQLEIEIRPHAAEVEAIIPQLVDPGTDSFDIMIENEAGERYLYRAPVRSCGVPGAVRITHDVPFRRDLPLFGQAGGYTFRNTGKHRLWADFSWAGGRARSNVLEVEVRRETNLSAAEEKYRAVLKDEDVGQLLFHRRDPTGSGILRLNRYLEREGATDGRGELHYALARATSSRHVTAKRPKALRIAVEALVQKALQDSERSSFQADRRNAMLGSMS